MNKDSLLDREGNLSTWLLATFLISITTAVITTSVSYLPAAQAAGLIHFAAGLALAILLPTYLLTHFLRTLGMRRPAMLVSGVLAGLICFGLIASGLHIGLLGRAENRYWVYLVHYGLGITTVCAVALHVVLHYVLLPDKRRAKAGSAFLTLSGLRLRTVSAGIGAITAALIILAADIGSRGQRTLKPSTLDYEYSYGPHPFRPSQTETSGGGFVHESEIADSEYCSSCHVEIAAQWQASAHRLAAADPTYVTNVMLLEKNKGIAATRYCEGCHAPIALLTGELTPGGKHGGVEGTAANREGISCTSCHRISKATNTKGVASFEFSPATPYLFGLSDSPLLRTLNRFLISVLPRQHKQEMSMPVLADPKLCATCHAQFMDSDLNDWGWVQMQDDYSAWLDGPFAAQHEQRFANSTLQRCQDCHMPLTKANDPSSDVNGMVRDHRFLGGNTMLPTVLGDKVQLELTQRFLQNNKMRVSIQKPYRKNPTQNLQALAAELRSTPVKPWYMYKEEAATINVVISNVGVGHSFPAGTIDINEAWVHFRVTDAEGNLVFESGSLDKQLFVDPEAYFYRSLPVDRHGQLVWKHDLFNMVGEVSRNVVKAGESDVVIYQFVVPSWSKGPLSISSSLLYRKLNQRYAKWALGDNYIDLPITEMARAFLSVPVRDREEAR